MSESRFERIKGLAKALLSPKAPNVMAQEMMEKRKKRLEQIGPKKTGGMLDVIYKGKKAREDAMQEYMD